MLPKNKEYIAEGLLNDIVVTFYGKSQVCIENYQSIIYFDSNVLRVKSSQYQLVIIGNGFYIRFFAKEEIVLVGDIQKILYEDIS